MSTATQSTTLIRKWINFLTSSNGTKTAVVFDLKNNSVKEIMEDFFDNLTVSERLNEPTIWFEEVKKQLLSRNSIA